MVQQLRSFHLPANHPIISKLATHPTQNAAIRHVPSGNTYTYGSMLKDIGFWRKQLSELTKVESIPGSSSRVAIMGENSYQFACVFYAALTLPNTLAVPLCTNHTAAEIEYQLDNSQAEIIVTPERFANKLNQFDNSQIPEDNKTRKLYTFEAIQPLMDENEPVEILPSVSFDGAGYMLYTSGTSGKPKGVITPIDTFVAQAEALRKVWLIDSSTNFLHTLPLHHVHGILIALTIPMLVGGRVEFSFPFSPESVVNRIIGKDAVDIFPKEPSKPSKPSPPITTYTAVPTIYTKLNSYLGEAGREQTLEQFQAGMKNIKLAMCGSAALPDPLREAWFKTTNGLAPLLERYGMTETGITLSQPLNPESRVAGTVGKPVYSVVARVVDPDTQAVLYQSSDINGKDGKTPEAKVEGDLLISGPTVFSGYWKRDDATKEAFHIDEDGTRWFITGDVARYDPSVDAISILGRSSMDIIKSGGEKISALEIERELLGLPYIAQTAVLGVPDEYWGEKVAAVVVLSKEVEGDIVEVMKHDLKDKLAGWKIPKIVKPVPDIPRNQMGKVNKKTLLKQLF